MTTKSSLTFQLHFASFPTIPLDLQAPSGEHVVGRDRDEQSGSCEDGIVRRDALNEMHQLLDQLGHVGVKQTRETHSRKSGSRILIVNT